jgi:3-oxoacyl-[acyl-carrier protein] reductase
MNYIEALFNLDKKVVLVTGACGQLGKVMCKAFKSSGCEVIGIDIAIDKNLVDGIAYFELDSRKLLEKQKLFNFLFEEYKRIDVLVLNAGVSTFDDFEKRTEADFDWVIDVNLKAVFFDIQTYVNLIDKNKQSNGSIINIGSLYGEVSPDSRIYVDLPRKNSEVYGASKAGVVQMTKYFSTHLAERQIRVNCISPGGILNPENPQGEEFQKSYAYRTPMKRMANTEEIVGAALYFASDSSSYTTGQNIIIDGGFSSW